METKKQEAIRLAYGEYWKNVKELVDENGWFWGENNILNFTKDFDTKGFSKTLRFRPKSLSGIEDNNGWISIESEEDLPKDERKNPVWVRDKNGKITCDVYHNNWPNQKKWFIETFTHYKLIPEPQPPIF